jgi:hypothetical protein
MTKEQLWRQGDELDRRAAALERERADLTAEAQATDPKDTAAIARLTARFERLAEKEREIAEKLSVNTEFLASRCYGEAAIAVDKLRDFDWGDATFATVAQEYITTFDSNEDLGAAIRACSSLLDLYDVWMRRQEQP